MSPYTVYASGQKVDDIYGKGYFPRQYHYLREARFVAGRLVDICTNLQIVDKNGKAKKL